MPITVKKIPFGDFEALQHIVQDNRSDIVQLGRGRMTGTMTHLALGPLALSTGSFSHAVRARGVLGPTQMMLAMLTESRGPAVNRGGTIGVGDLEVTAPGEERFIRFADQTSFLVAVAEPDALAAHLASEPGALDRLWRFRVAVLSDHGSAQTSVNKLRQLIDRLSEVGPMLSDDAAEFFQSNLLDLLTAPISAAVPYHGARVVAPDRLVREVDQYLIEAGSRPVTVTELLDVFRVSRRSLHRAFHDVLGIAPVTFNRNRRLGHVHSALKAGGPHTLISLVAAEHGFLQHGKFTQEYKRLFGELPSDTLRKALHRSHFVQIGVTIWLVPLLKRFSATTVLLDQLV
jgi:AraC family ethanolamine operon transcriptional activator